MTKVQWDQTGERLYETGVDHGVLYLQDPSGAYSSGYPWNGLTTVTESPDGAEATPQYADNMKYLNLVSAENLNGTIEAFTYPKQFGLCDGTAQPQPGVNVGQQSRKTFGLSYRTKLGNDLEADDYGYKLHLIWGALAAPSEKAYATINDSPEPITFSWEFSTSPVPVTGLKPTSIITIDSTEVGATALAALEDLLYGTSGTDPRLPTPDEVIALFAGAITVATATAPTFDAETNVITIPTVAGVKYVNNETGATLTSGAQAALEENESVIIRAVALAGYALASGLDTDWYYVGGNID